MVLQKEITTSTKVIETAPKTTLRWILLACRSFAVDLVEVVLLRDDVKNLGRVLAVVRGVPLAHVLDPAILSETLPSRTQTGTLPQPPWRSLEYSDHPVGAVVHVLKVPATTTSQTAHKDMAKYISSEIVINKTSSVNAKTSALFNDGVMVLVNFVGVHLVKKALFHKWAGVVLSVNPITLTGHVVVNATANVGHVWALCKVVTHHACSKRHASLIKREEQPGSPAYLVVQMST